MRKFLSVAKMAMLDGLEYRTDVLLYTLSGLVRPLIFLAIWLAALSSGANTSYTKQDFINYYLLVMVLHAWVSVWTSPFLIQKVRYGTLSPYLLKPFPYLFHDLANNVGEKFFKLSYSLVVALILGIFFKVQLPAFTILEFIIFAFSLVTAFFLNYLIDICIGLVAFWTGEAYSLGDFLDLFMFIFSGLLFPLELLSANIQKLAGFIPFRYTLSFPIEIYLRKLSSSEIVFGLIMQTIWLGATVILYKMMWRRGLKEYSAVGA